jgi:hypothetical protein
MSATSIHYHPNLFVGKAMSLPIERSLIRGFAVVGSSLAQKYYIRVEVATLGYSDTANITTVKSLKVQPLGPML